MSSFIYDSVGFSELRTGSFETGIINFAGDGTDWITTSQSVYTNFDDLNDLSADTAATVTGTWRSIRFDLGSSKTKNCFAGLYTDSSTPGSEAVHVYTSSNADDSYYLRDESTLNQSKVWYVANFSANSNRYVVWQPYVSGTTTNLYECFIGTNYTFEQEPDLRARESSIFGTNTITSAGGVNHTFKRHNKRKTWELSWSNISSAMKDDLETFRNSVTSLKPFLYYDGSTYNRVRLTNTVDFTEVSYGRYQTSVSMIEVLDIYS
tara:strand:+ start:1719 stop:2510 length:792 start_codon:yes stop_codon:yes gene_type:complete